LQISSAATLSNIIKIGQNLTE